MDNRKQLQKLIVAIFEKKRKTPKKKAVDVLATVGAGILEAQGIGGGLFEPSPQLKREVLVDKLVRAYLKGEKTSPHAHRHRWGVFRTSIEALLGEALGFEEDDPPPKPPAGAVLDALASVALGFWPEDGEHTRRALIVGFVVAYYVEGRG